MLRSFTPSTLLLLSGSVAAGLRALHLTPVFPLSGSVTEGLRALHLTPVFPLSGSVAAGLRALADMIEEGDSMLLPAASDRYAVYLSA